LSFFLYYLGVWDGLFELAGAHSDRDPALVRRHFTLLAETMAPGRGVVLIQVRSLITVVGLILFAPAIFLALYSVLLFKASLLVFTFSFFRTDRFLVFDQILSRNLGLSPTKCFILFSLTVFLF
jgi:hypothetical protein